MKKEIHYRAADIYSCPARGKAPARRGVLPIGRTQFYELLKRGDIPQPDARVGSTRLWSDSRLKRAIAIGETRAETA